MVWKRANYQDCLLYTICTVLHFFEFWCDLHFFVAKFSHSDLRLKLISGFFRVKISLLLKVLPSQLTNQFFPFKLDYKPARVIFFNFLTKASQDKPSDAKVQYLQQWLLFAQCSRDLAKSFSLSSRRRPFEQHLWWDGIWIQSSDSQATGWGPGIVLTENGQFHSPVVSPF